MRSTMYTSDKKGYAQLAAIARNGWLIVVPNPDDANRVRELIQLFGGRCLADIVEAQPNVKASSARENSVEVRTMAEIETMDANEKLAMEVW